MANLNNRNLIDKIKKFGISDLEKLNILEIFTRKLIIDQVINKTSFSVGKIKNVFI